MHGELHPISVGIAVGFALLGTLSLFWSARGAVNEFSYPIDGDGFVDRLEGLNMLLAVYILGGWIMSVLAAVISVPGASPQDTAASFALVGICFIAVLRIYTMSRTYGVDRSVGPSSVAGELVLLLLATGFGLVFLLVKIGDLTTYIQQVAPTRTVNPQPQTAILIMGTLLAALFAEAVWFGWTHTNSYETHNEQVAESSIASLSRESDGVAALEIGGTVTRQARTFPLEAIKIMLRDRYGQMEVERAMALLYHHRVIVPVTAGAFRRHPHFAKAQWRHISKAARITEAAENLSTEDVVQLLAAQAEEATLDGLPRVIEPYLLLRGPNAGTERRILMDEILEGLEEDESNPRDALLARYIRGRYWDGRSVTDLAQELGYSREHLSRSVHHEAIRRFHYHLISRIAGRLG